MRLIKQENKLYKVYKDNGMPIPNIVGKKHIFPNRMKAEVNRLYKIRHLDGVVKIHSYNGNVIFLDEIEGEDLYTILEKRKRFSEYETRYIAICLLRIVRNLHAIKIIHGDIKPENIMYNENTKDVILVDFEYRRHTANYAAPETIQIKKYGCKSDVWGIGATIYTMLMGHNPYNDNNHLFSGISYHEMDKNISVEARDFINNTLVIDYHMRPNIQQCFQYPWITKMGITLIQYEIPVYKRRLTPPSPEPCTYIKPLEIECSILEEEKPCYCLVC